MRLLEPRLVICILAVVLSVSTRFHEAAAAVSSVMTDPSYRVSVAIAVYDEHKLVAPQTITLSSVVLIPLIGEIVLTGKSA